jgi:hypothetical protein
MPTSGLKVKTAEQVTGGLLEFNCLPSITWAPSYLARISADAHGKLAPTPQEADASYQASCILYVNKVNLRAHFITLARISFAV